MRFLKAMSDKFKHQTIIKKYVKVAYVFSRVRANKYRVKQIETKY